MKISQESYKQRREKIFSQMKNNSIGFIVAAPHYHRNFDNEMVYRQSSDMHYVTGFPEPQAIAVLSKRNQQTEFILFSKKREPAKEIWTGPIVGQERARTLYGADQAFDIDTFEDKLPELIQGCDSIYYEFGDHDLATLLSDALETLICGVRSGIGTPSELCNIHKILHEMRLRKSEEEIKLMATVGDISAYAHMRCMQSVAPDQFEYQLEAEFRYHMMQQGCRHFAYPGIFASGENACILHYTANDRQMRDGDLVLIDAGAEMDCYASDITRTFPVNGRFSGEQRALYDIVLDTQLKVIDSMKPGADRGAIEILATENLTAGLIELGIIKTSLAQALEQKSYAPFYMHRIGHWLGIDTHDRGDYKIGEAWRKLEPGFVLTAEPGLYISPNTKGVEEKWWGMGIRIEDDVAITKDGNRVLSATAPKQIDDIEALIQNG